MKISASLWISVVIAASYPCLAFAGEARIQTAIDATDSGWYHSKGVHDPDNPSYYVGDTILANDLHNYFVFDLSGVTGKIIAAELHLVNPFNGYSSGDASEEYALFEVSTPIPTLLAGGSGLTGIYADLRTGSSYGSKTVSSADNGTTIVVPLNENFLSAANGTSGKIAIGGAIETLDSNVLTNEFIFGSTGAGPPSDIQLVLTTIDEPRSALSLPVVGVLVLLLVGALVVIRQRRARIVSS